MLGTIASWRRDRELGRKSCIPRRAFVTGGWAAACTLSGVARAATTVAWPNAESSRRFSVFHDNTWIGVHSILHAPASGEVRVVTDIRLQAKVAFLTVFRFNHRSTELWRAGQLMSLTAETLEHGEMLRVDGAATPQGFRVVSKGGPFLAPAGTLTSNSLWTPAVLEQTSLVDAQHGGIIGVSARRLADEQISVGGRPIRATRYSFITPYLAGSIWYDSGNFWVRGDFECDGSKIHYLLDT